MTMLLNRRQQLCEALAKALGQMKGVWLTSPLPLDDSKKLRLQISDFERNHIIQTIRNFGYEPVCLGVAPRFDVMGLVAASAYEVDLPRERQPIVDDRKIYGELAERKKAPSETEAVMRYLGLAGPTK